MNFKDLKIYECPELKIVKNEVIDDEIKWGDLITPEHERFKIKHSKSELSGGELRIFTFTNEELLGLQFVENKKSGSVYHDSYCNYVDFNIEYRRLHIMKIVHLFGVKVFKKSEEKFLDPIILHSVEYHFEYNFVDDQWNFLSDVERFESTRREIEELRNSPSIRDINRNYFSIRKEAKADIQNKTLKDTFSYDHYLGLWQKLIKETREFHKNKKMFGELSELNFRLIEEQLKKCEIELNILYKNTKELNLLSSKRETHQSKEQDKLIEAYADILGSLNNTIYVTGYWVQDGNVLPNINEIYELLQKAKKNRNDQSKNKLHNDLLKYAETEKKSFITLTDLEMKKNDK